MWPLATQAMNCMWRGNLIHLSWIVEMHLTLAPRGNVEKSFRLGITLDSINFTWCGAAVGPEQVSAVPVCFFYDSYVLRLVQTWDFGPLETQTGCIYAVCICSSLSSALSLLLFLLVLAGHQQLNPPTRSWSSTRFCLVFKDFTFLVCHRCLINKVWLS